LITLVGRIELKGTELARSHYALITAGSSKDGLRKKVFLKLQDPAPVITSPAALVIRERSLGDEGPARVPTNPNPGEGY
jgi:hypothetical protein